MLPILIIPKVKMTSTNVGIYKTVIESPYGSELELTVTFDYFPAEPATRSHPGSDEEIDCYKFHITRPDGTMAEVSLIETDTLVEDISEAIAEAKEEPV